MPQPTVVLLTIGGNELPSLVAARRLWEIFQAVDAVPPIFWPIRSDEVADHTQRVRRFLAAKADQLTSEHWVEIPVKAYDPDDIYIQVHRRIAKAKGRIGRLHLHYTGGTSAMALHSFEALTSHLDQALPIETSYLDGRSNRLVSRNWKEKPMIGRLLPADERATWSLTVEQLVDLRGGSLNAKRERRFNPQTLSQFEEALREPDVARRSELAEAVKRSSSDSGAAFEVWAAGELQAALERVHPSGQADIRSNLYIRPSREADEQFEIDVATVLGYQLFAATVTMKPDKAGVKLKALEASYRARQIGGDHAYTCCVSWMNAKDTVDLAGGLQLDLGRDHKSAVWGMGDLRSLRDNFAHVLENDLKWGPYE